MTNELNLPEGWEVKKLGDACKVIGGGTPSKTNDDFYGGDIFWATVRDMNEEIITDTEHKITKDAVKNSSTNIIPKGNVIIATRVGLGKICLLKHDTAINQDLRGIVPVNPEKLSVDFLYRWFQSIAHQIIEAGTGATVQGVKLPFVKSLPIPLPPFEEQKRIVAILDEAFASIAKAKESAEKILKNANEIFESYLQSVFENKGEGWDEKKLGEIAEVFGGFAFKSDKFTKAGKYQILRMGNVRPGLIRMDKNPVFIDKIDDKTLSRSLLRKHDIIITQTGTRKKRDYGYTVAIDEDYYLLNQRLAAIRFPVFFNYKFFLYFSWSNKFRDQFFANETGMVGQGNVGISAVTGALIPVPIMDEQQVIVTKLDTLSAETKKLEAIYTQKLADLEELKKSILQKAFNGELTEASA